MLADLVTRFILGGAIVSVFSALGEIWKPKTFGGLFGAAPSVGIATLALAFGKDGAAEVAIKAEWFAVACLAMLVYCAACVTATKRAGLPVWLGASGAWLAWGLSAVGVWLVARGALPS